MKRPILVMLDGEQIKAVNINDLPDSAWTWYSPHVSTESKNVETYSKAVGWLYRAVTLRAQALSGLPFSLVSGDGSDYDTSATWENKCGFLPSPARLLWLVEAALCLTAQAYLYRQTAKNGNTLLGLRYLLPTSVEPQFSEADGLTGFERRLASRVVSFTTEEIVYFWLPDPWVELGPGTAPAQAALASAGVLYNKDRFVAGYFERGAIKAMLLTVGGSIPEPERNRLRDWWRRTFRGIEKSWQSEVVNADLVKPVVVGEGLQDLTDVELTKEAREDICTTLGIPLSLMMSNAANYATSQTDVRNFLDHTIVPEAGFVAGVLNEQVFEPLGLRWEFRPETLDAYQEDESNRAQALAAYVQAGTPLGLAMKLLGVELPDGVEYEDLGWPGDDEEEAEPETPGADEEGVSEDEQPDAVLWPGAEGETLAAAIGASARRADLSKWQRVALRRFKEGKGLDYAFESDAIPPNLAATIRAALAVAASEEEIKAAFKQDMAEIEPAGPLPLGVEEMPAGHHPGIGPACPLCGNPQSAQYADHGNLCVCPACKCTFDPGAYRPGSVAAKATRREVDAEVAARRKRFKQRALEQVRGVLANAAGLERLKDISDEEWNAAQEADGAA